LVYLYRFEARRSARMKAQLRWLEPKVSLTTQNSQRGFFLQKAPSIGRVKQIVGAGSRMKEQAALTPNQITMESITWADGQVKSTNRLPEDRRFISKLVQ